MANTQDLQPGHVWFCPVCGKNVTPNDVTYSERHDERSGGCGGVVVSVPVKDSNIAMRLLTQKEAEREMAEVGDCPPIEQDEIERIVALATQNRFIAITHGVNCPKYAHSNVGGYLHADDDDTPYSVDGVMYCGRCHHWLG